MTQETLELQHKQSKAVATTCLSFPQNDVNNFLVGSEEGTVYSACRHGSRAGVLDLYEGHQVGGKVMFGVELVISGYSPS